MSASSFVLWGVSGLMLMSGSSTAQILSLGVWFSSLCLWLKSRGAIERLEGGE